VNQLHGAAQPRRDLRALLGQEAPDLQRRAHAILYFAEELEDEAFSITDRRMVPLDADLPHVRGEVSFERSSLARHRRDEDPGGPRGALVAGDGIEESARGGRVVHGVDQRARLRLDWR
jgi:hypothetical protein